MNLKNENCITIAPKDISVVVQGPIVPVLTQKCLESIHTFLPDAEVILSTWEGSDVSGLDYDIIVLSKDPGGIKHDYAIYNASRSMNNFNRQLISTQNGIKKTNRPYILKLRSDLELKNADFLTYWHSFPCRDSEYRLFTHRVLCGCLYSREHSCQAGLGYPTPFHPSDFWFFGCKEDICNYYLDCPAQSPEESGNWEFKYPNRCPYIQPLWRYAPEQWFCLYWVKKYYSNIHFDDWSDWNDINIKLSHKIMYNNFIFIGYEQSGIYSEKYFETELNKYSIQGLITYTKFEKQYKKYCDVLYTPQYIPVKIYKNDIRDHKELITFYKMKLKKHIAAQLYPFHKFKKWTEEIFCILYYGAAFVLAVLKFPKKQTSSDESYADKKAQ